MSDEPGPALPPEPWRPTPESAMPPPVPPPGSQAWSQPGSQPGSETGSLPVPSPMGSWGPPPAAPKPGVIPLRPLGIPELLDGSITAIRRYPKATLVPSFLVALALGAVNFLTVLVSLTMYRGFEDLDRNTVTGSDIAGIFGPTVFVALVGGLVQFVATVLLTGIITAVMGQAVLGNPITLAEAWQMVRPRAWRLLGLGLLVGLIVGLGLVFCLVPGIILAVYLSVASAALVLERSTVGDSIGRSWRLVSGAFWRTFGALVLMVIIYFVINIAISVPFAIPELIAPSVDSTTLEVDETRFVINNAISTVGGVITSTITLPFIAAVISLIYIDRRMRTEGLDITLARQSQGL